MIGSFDPHKRYFSGVALGLIVSGAFIFTMGVIEWVMNIFSLNPIFGTPSQKVIGGLIILALGYIHLELEMMRTK